MVLLAHCSWITHVIKPSCCCSFYVVICSEKPDNIPSSVLCRVFIGSEGVPFRTRLKSLCVMCPHNYTQLFMFWEKLMKQRFGLVSEVHVV